MGQMDDLEALYKAYLKDNRFDHLRKQNINFVPGCGPLQPVLMIIGEAPGRMENARRVPFVGRSGINLNNLMEDVGIDPYNVFQTNVVKYWPQEEHGTKTRTPTEEEVDVSREYLLKEIDIVEPTIIGLCGRSAIQALFPQFTNVFEHHGKLLDGKFVPLYHPAVISYNPQKKHSVREGFTKLKAYMDARRVA